MRLGIAFDASVPNLLRSAIVALASGFALEDSAVATLSIRGGEFGHAEILTTDRRRLSYEHWQDAVAEADSWITRTSLDLGDPSLLRLHAAMFTFGAEGWLVAGVKGSGKSTLALDAIARGATQCCDERVRVTPSGPGVGVDPFSRSIHVRLLARETSRILGIDERALVESAQRTIIPQDAFADSERPTVDSLNLLLLGQPGSDRPATIASIALELLGHTLDAIRCGPTSLELLARLVSRCRSFRRPIRSLRSALDVTGDPDLDRPSQQPSISWDEPSRAARAQLRSDLRSLAIAEETLIWVQGTPPTVLQLDPDETIRWRAFLAGDVRAISEAATLSHRLHCAGIT